MSNWDYDDEIDRAAREILKPDRSEAQILTSILRTICLGERGNCVRKALREVLAILHLDVVEWAASGRPFDPNNYPDELSIEEGGKALEILKTIEDFVQAKEV